MRSFVLALALGLVTAAGSGHAALVSVTGGTAYVLPSTGGGKAYNNLSSGSVTDPWSGGTEVLLGATLDFAPKAKEVTVTFIGREASYANTFESGGSVLFKNGTSTPGTSIVMTVAEFAAAVFRSQGKGAGFGTGSERVAMSFAGNTLQLGFNDLWTGDLDYDDMRIAAVVTPVPAALPLLGSAILGLWGYRRWRRPAA